MLLYTQDASDIINCIFPIMMIFIAEKSVWFSSGINYLGVFNACLDLYPNFGYHSGGTSEDMEEGESHIGRRRDSHVQG